ncbi:hypothetical protein C8R44DRAFT_766192 [Mycena epipterygia]|nr:hypothetical protein C8R44DRAFT_766192 [Mycena epipterygia]
MIPRIALPGTRFLATLFAILVFLAELLRDRPIIQGIMAFLPTFFTLNPAMSIRISFQRENRPHPR